MPRLPSRAPPSDPRDVLDLEELRVRAGRDEDLVIELLGDFLERTSEMSALAASVAIGDFLTTSKLAHRLKGALLALGAKAAARAAMAVEHQAAALAAETTAPLSAESLEGAVAALRTHCAEACAAMQAACDAAPVKRDQASGWR